jgi:hypothetical protein
MTRVYETSISRREWRSIYHPNYPIGILIFSMLLRPQNPSALKGIDMLLIRSLFLHSRSHTFRIDICLCTSALRRHLYRMGIDKLVVIDCILALV